MDHAKHLKSSMGAYLKQDRLAIDACKAAHDALIEYAKTRGNIARLADTIGVTRSYLSDVIQENRILTPKLAKQIQGAL